MSLSKELQKLKEYKCDSRCVLSVYLNTNPADPEQQNGAWRIHLKTGLKRLHEYLEASNDEKELKAYKKLRDKVTKEIETNQNDFNKGVVIFAAEDPELWSVHYVQVQVKTSFHWEDHPVIEEMEYMLKAYPEAGIVLPSFGEVRILDTAMGFITGERSYAFDSGLDVWKENDSVKSSLQTGTGEGNSDGLDQRLKENLERFYKEMGVIVERIRKERDWKELYVVGEAELANSFAKTLRTKPNNSIYKNLINVQADKVLHQVFEK
ncbi:VLRF1 family aeRF1-type release factor [Sporosarcina highlanderae]|uniref:VLRF1 family aeRF1-type release factor n=1 Tax=Sporosarcina highlanderae TaxID=3035916 RepID=A0ABT8JRX6_9BACL|nr:VLRF1 family aeRF1-type release factor [Sporosarcina highlanderae]MDN4607885.1 VLRF1 family aeRF1-type release factor [Sporosarcina highlanderae]